jgi:hypothetical protein
VLPALLDLGDGPNQHCDVTLSKNNNKNALTNISSSLTTFGQESRRETVSGDNRMNLCNGLNHLDATLSKNKEKKTITSKPFSLTNLGWE